MTVYKPKGRTVFVMDFIYEGKRVKRSTKRTNRKDALAVEAETRRRLMNAEQLGDLPVIGLHAALHQWSTDYGSHLKSAKDIKTVVGIMTGTCAAAESNNPRRRRWVWPDKPLHALTEADLRFGVNQRFREGLAAGTVLFELSMIKRTVGKLKGIYKTPNLRFPSAREDRRLKANEAERFLSEAEIRTLLKHLDQKRADQSRVDLIRGYQDAYDLAVFMLNTGARPNEALTMLWSDIDLNKRTLTLTQHKVSNYTGLSISTQLLEVLTRRRERTNSPYVFPSPTGDGPRTTYAALVTALDAVGLNTEGLTARYGKATPYSLRHTYASRLAQSGKVTLHDISKLMGHSTIGQTQKYAHLIPSKVAASAVEALDELNAPQ